MWLGRPTDRGSNPMKKHQVLAKIRITLAIAIALGVTCTMPSLAQVSKDAKENRSQDHSKDRSRTSAMEKSRAELAAEELVSLSADTIVNFLRNDPGLLLQVKRALVKKAYEQGRLLDPRDLEDDMLFRLIQDDQNVRVLITREIEAREKMARDAARAEGSHNDSELGSEQPPGGSNSPTPSDNRAPRAPGTPRSLDPRRQLEQTQLPPTAGDLDRGLPTDRLSLPPVRPNELPNLLSAATNDQPVNLLTRPRALPEGYPAGVNPPLSLPAGPTSSSSLDEALITRPRTERRPPGTPLRSPEVPADQRGLNHRANPYADVPSLYDLYSQYAAKSGALERFGLEVFRNGTGNFDDLPMDMPVGPEYVLGPGDGLSIDLWGGVSQRFQRVVDRQGRVALPEVGAVEVSGRNLGDVQRLVQSVLRTQFRDVEADVSLARLRTVRVYVVGDVERAGAYDVSSLSTPLNAVYEAGGPTATRFSAHSPALSRESNWCRRSMSTICCSTAVRSDLEGLQPGDTILVPPLGPEVTIEGMVRRPAIYELGSEKNLAEVLELAGGVLQSGTLRHIDVERVEAHLSRTMLRLDIPEDQQPATVAQALEDFQVQDGDKIKISPILPYADKTVYLEGHAFRPGQFAYRDGMKVTDVIKSYSDLLPEPYKRHAEIIRLSPPDYTPIVLAFNLDDALAGKDQDLVLRPFDTIRVFSRFDFEDPPVITVNGASQRSGRSPDQWRHLSARRDSPCGGHNSGCGTRRRPGLPQDTRRQAQGDQRKSRQGPGRR